ncbi:hypothetical protein B0H17DRAFT_1242937 [Mycena rosella]|uniref:Uncharacterized protein n=1 Tax=Mycena rosella TaxID=1033263 RepID=A0AAD7AX10_MYCRO|nr:hypothetical protein B0H17DRAFT_1242937 [Mycena rosella]
MVNFFRKGRGPTAVEKLLWSHLQLVGVARNDGCDVTGKVGSGREMDNARLPARLSQISRRLARSDMGLSASIAAQSKGVERTISAHTAVDIRKDHGGVTSSGSGAGGKTPHEDLGRNLKRQIVPLDRGPRPSGPLYVEEYRLKGCRSVPGVPQRTSRKPGLGSASDMQGKCEELLRVSGVGFFESKLDFFGCRRDVDCVAEEVESPFGHRGSVEATLISHQLPFLVTTTIVSSLLGAGLNRGKARSNASNNS